jgi:Tol biopolymer transport system component
MAGPVPIAAFTTDAGPRALSGDGRYVVFQSFARLVASDHNSDVDVYVRDRQTGVLTRVSTVPGGGDANGSSFSPTISSNGRYVAFLSVASDLVPGDHNDWTDCFVFDRELQSTTRVNVGPSGEESATGCAAMGVSGDGRYVVVDGQFDGGPSNRVWVRDRDSDGNGIVGEAGTETLTEIPYPSPSGTEQLFGLGWMTMSDDARYVSFTPEVYAQDWSYLGTRLYVHDRMSGGTTLIGPPSSTPQAPQYATAPDFGDGVLAYVTNAPNLVPGDTGLDLDVFVINLLTGGQSRVALTHAGAPPLSQSWAPAISRDGRFVAFAGTELIAGGIERRDVYVVDRTLDQSFLVSTRPDGSRATRVGEYPSISADGSAISFLASPDLLVDYSANDGVFVATDFSLSPATLEVSPDGEAAAIHVGAPAATGWQARSVAVSAPLNLLELSPASGAGTGDVNVALPPNHTGQTREYRVIAGSEQVMVRQPSGPEVLSVDPVEGTPTGGTAVTIVGNGFSPDATVRFGGQPATNVVVESLSVIHAVTPPGMPGHVDVVVTNGDGRSTRLELGFSYFNAPTIAVPAASGVFGGSADLRATLSSAGGPLAGRLLRFFVADVSVGTATTLSSGQATLTLALAGRPVGSHDVRVDFDGDATASAASGSGALDIGPAPLSIRADDATKRYGESLPAFTATPTGLVGGDTLAALGTLTFVTAATSTSAPGSYAVTPGGVSSANYAITFVAGTLTVVRADTSVSVIVAVNPSKRGNDYDVSATVGVVAPGAGTPTGSVSFYDGGEFVASVPVQGGVATLTMKLPRRGRLISAVYTGDLNFSPSGSSEVLASITPKR